MTAVTRRSRVAIVAAVVALLSVVQIPALSLIHGLGGDDSCSAEQYDPSTRVIKGPQQAPSQHCPICHRWQSAGRFSGPGAFSTPIPVLDLGLIAKPVVVAPELSLTTIRSVRAPPAV
jgi:hypothetical protein